MNTDKWEVIDTCVGDSMCFLRMLSPKVRDHTHTIEVKTLFVSRGQFINCRLWQFKGRETLMYEKGSGRPYL